MFCNYAASRGAKRTEGVDWPNNAMAAQMVAFYLGNHNADYCGTDIDGVKAFKPYDIVFFLSMNIHVGFPEWIPNATKELLIFEENAKGSRFKPDCWQKELEEYFKKVELVAYSDDGHKGMPIFYCWK